MDRNRRWRDVVLLSHTSMGSRTLSDDHDQLFMFTFFVAQFQLFMFTFALVCAMDGGQAMDVDPPTL
jgi:hypothetical protein